MEKMTALAIIADFAALAVLLLGLWLVGVPWKGLVGLGFLIGLLIVASTVLNEKPGGPDD